MPSTYTLISSNVLTSSAASVTFSAIPSTYTDLVIRTSTRSDASGFWNYYIAFAFNGSATSYSYRTLYGNGSTAASGGTSGASSIDYSYQPAASATANTFGSLELYIPNYTVAQNKPSSIFYVDEANTSTADLTYLGTGANLWQNTAAITSITISNGSKNFVSGSSFYLYGISKN